MIYGNEKPNTKTMTKAFKRGILKLLGDCEGLSREQFMFYLHVIGREVEEGVIPDAKYLVTAGAGMYDLDHHEVEEVINFGWPWKVSEALSDWIVDAEDQWAYADESRKRHSGCTHTPLVPYAE